MENAIKLAIEEGYEKVWNDYRKDWVQAKIALDPFFWQSLGKSLGWNDEPTLDDDGTDWVTEWHSFIDHLASDKDADSFFKELLSK